MNARQRLDEYLSQLRQRLQWAILSRASAVLASIVLGVLCVAMVWLAPRGFPASGVIVTRVVMLLGIVAAVSLLLWLPLKRLRSGPAALERQLPNQEGRVQTFLELREREARGESAFFTDLLAEDAMKRAESAPVESIVTPQRLWTAAGVAGVALAALVYLVGFGSTQWGYGTRHVLFGAEIPKEVIPPRAIVLKPGDKTVRRNADLAVQAKVSGFKPQGVELFVQYEGTDEWERAPMQVAPGEEDGNYLMTLYALRAPLTYYAEVDGVKSQVFHINVVDVPRIEGMQVRYQFPEWTGLEPAVEKESFDIHAVVDTQIQLSVQSSEPLDRPVLVFNETQAAMTPSAKNTDGKFVVTKADRYHLASHVAGELVALTDDYEIALLQDGAPTVEVVKPGRDWRATSVEEVPITIRAQDDFRLQALELRYSVNGGEFKTIKLPASAPKIETKSILQMESLGGTTPLVPGDLVSYYAVAKDRKQSAQTDLFMVQVQPFERRFTEGQGGGGGGDGGSEQEQIAERQREILVATWNLQRAKDQQRRTPQQIKESGEMLSGLQEKLAEQTNTLIERTRARTRGNTDQRVKSFLESLELAGKAMTPAVTQLKALELPKAVPNEQQALQMLLRAESSFRDIQVTRQANSQGNGSARTSNDITELYELEMDLNKNKYETEKELSQETPNQEVDAALAKLKELAERQEKLAEQQRMNQMQANADRWKQEQLRREAEELRRRLQEMARQQSAPQGAQAQGSQSQSSQSQSSQANSQSNSSQSGQQSQADVKAALQALENALQAMRNAEAANEAQANRNAQNQNNQSNQADPKINRNTKAADEASRNLRQAARNIESGATQQALSKSLEQLAEQARQLANAQRSAENDLYRAVSKGRNQEGGQTRRDGLSPAEARDLANQKQAVLDELERMQGRLRETAQGQRGAAPKTAKRVGEIADELSSGNISSRLSRTIVDLERGRADQAMMGEGLITEALQNAASDLRNATKLAQEETRERAESISPEALLAELADLRRAIQAAQAQRRAGQVGTNEQNRERSEIAQQRGAPNEQSMEGSREQSSSQAQASSQSPGQQQGQQQGQQSAQQSGQLQGSQNGSPQGGPRLGQPGVIDGGLRTGSLNTHQIGDGERAPAMSSQQLANLRQQLNGLQQRIANGTLSQSDLAALRAVRAQVRSLSGSPVADRTQLLQSIDRLELAALGAAEKARKSAAARVGTSASSAEQEGETVAEYYRRLAK